MEEREGKGREKRGKWSGEERLVSITILNTTSSTVCITPSTYTGDGFGEDLFSVIQQFSHNMCEFVELTMLALLQEREGGKSITVWRYM